jgi:hypothetical protein
MKIQQGSYSNNRAILSFYLLTGLYILAVLLHVSYYPLNGDEPRRAIVAIEMRNSGNFIMPTTLGWEYYNKPPVYNWLISASMFLLGTESELAVRLPSLVAILLWAWCNYRLLKNIIPPEVAALSSLFLLTALDIFLWGLGNGGEIDIFYSFIVYLQVIFIFYFNEKKDWSALFITSYLFCAIGMLTKGFPSILFQGLTLFALCAYNRSMAVLLKWQHLAGILVFCGITGGYLFAYSYYSDPGRLLINLLRESFVKSVLSDDSNRLVNKMISFPFNILKTLLPWSLLLVLLLKKKRFRFWSNPFIKFALLFMLFNLPVYWITGQSRMRYIYMFMPFFTVMIAFVYYEIKHDHPVLMNKIYKWLKFPFVLLLLAIVVLPFFIEVNISWLIAMVLLTAVYLVYYRNAITHHLWYFGVGIIIFRLAVASLYLPVWYQQLDLKYDKQLAQIARRNNFQPLNIYCKADTLDLCIDLKIAKFHYDSIAALPFLAYQIPYYYYRYTGYVLYFDTVLTAGRNYLGFRSALPGNATEEIYSYRDKNHNGDDVVLFHARVPQEPLTVKTSLKK